MSKRVLVQAPSNIALIKYMGKTNSEKNIPVNPSLSMTLDRLSTLVEARRADQDTWLEGLPEASVPGRWSAPQHSEHAQFRVLAFLEKARLELPTRLSSFGLEFDVFPIALKTANSFPESAGIASSASAFAGLTLAIAALTCRDSALFQKKSSLSEFKKAISALSREGSGSSCRSFDGPWVLWEGEHTSAPVVHEAFRDLTDLVLIVETAAKKVSSSDAHRVVLDSPLWSGRQEKLKERMPLFLKSLAEGDWANVSRLSFQEAWEMHSLFHTAPDPFTYWNADTMKLLNWYQALESEQMLKSMLTLDAGPNLHLIVPTFQVEDWIGQIQEQFPEVRIEADRAGAGARILEID